MLYIVSQKFFKKNADRLVAPNQYFIIDGENHGVTDSRKESISSKYNNTHPLGGWCPETELYRMLVKRKKGEDVSEKKFTKYVEEYLKSSDFIAAVCASAKAQATYGVDEDINIFVVLPGVVAKQLGKTIRKRIYKIIKVDCEFVRLQDDINKHNLSDTLRKKDLKAILNAIKSAEKKYKLDYRLDDDDDD